jgi:hypothetical protein
MTQQPLLAFATTANRIRQFNDKLDEIEHEIPRLKEALTNFSTQRENPVATRSTPMPSTPIRANGQHKSPGKKIRIEVDWSRIGKDKTNGKEVICEHKASDSLTKFVIRLYQEIGEGILPKLNQVRISRGPLVSKSPQTDYVNNSTGILFQHQPVLETGYHVLTHSSNNEKIGYISKACQALRLPIGMVTAEELEKNNWLFTEF